MTLTDFAVRNIWRNKRRSILTIASLSLSLLLLTLMMTIWRLFYIDSWSTVSAEHVVCRHRVSLAVPLPAYYRDKIRTIPGVLDVIPLSLFDAGYKGPTPDDFAKIGTDPNEYLNPYPEYQIPPEQVMAWKKDPVGAIAGSELVRAIYFNWAYVQSAANYQKDQLYLIQEDSPQSVSRISHAIDGMFHNAPEPTRTEAE